MPKKNKWVIAIKERGDLFDLSNFKILEPPEGFYWADPFLFDNYVFYELYDYNKGVIAYSKVKDDMTLTEPVVCIDEPFHMSFPSVFSTDEGIFMSPECGLSGQLRVYKAVEFPNKWELYKVLASGNFADPVYYKGHIYTTEADNYLQIWRDYDKVLHAEYPHARSAGNIFEYEGKILRPTQDCVESYGKALVFYEMNGIVPLRPFKRIEPFIEGATGVHTFNFNDKHVVIDVRFPINEKNMDTA